MKSLGKCDLPQSFKPSLWVVQSHHPSSNQF